jgi:hypothetical protein
VIGLALRTLLRMKPQVRLPNLRRAGLTELSYR